MIKKVLEKLNALGYSIELRDGLICYENLNSDKDVAVDERSKDKKQAAECIRIIKNNVEAVRAELLRMGSFYAFPDVEDNSNPFPEKLKRNNVRLVGLKVFFEVLRQNIADTPNGYMPLMFKYQKAYEQPLSVGTEYPIIIRRKGITYMLKPYKVIKAYAEKGIARLEYRQKYDMLIMIFNDVSG